MGTYLSSTGSLARGPGVGVGLLTPEISLQNFYPPHLDEGPACSTSAPLLPVWMEVFLLFCSCQTSFNLISDISERWLFCILVVLLVWLCEEVSHVCLCRYLDWKPA